MAAPDATCWTMIRDAAGGDAAARDRFGLVYLPVVRAYLAARWRGLPLDRDDAVQDVFVECFKTGGMLERADEDRPGGFRAYLLGMVRNVARRYEDRQRQADVLSVEHAADDTGPAEAFDRAWARALLRQAARVQEITAHGKDASAVRRIELLRLRFEEGRPIRDIAVLWDVEAAKLHHEYAVARNEYRAALREVVAFHHPGATAGEIEQLCSELAELVA